MNYKTSLFAILGPVTLCAALSATEAWAADAAAEAPPATVAEVVVTANKRSENLRDVPISIGVISGAAIAGHHVDDIEDISRTVPGVSFAAHAGAGQDNISIRGVSSTVGNPTVSIYIDEVPLITTNGYEGAAQPKLIDLSQIEVLRGPQGTLYGASSEGGTIRYLTNQPNLGAFSGMLSTELSDTKHGGFNNQEQGMVNIPLANGKAAIRISGDYTHDSGYIDNFSLDGRLLNKGVNSETDKAVHISGLIEPGAGLTISPSLFLQKIDTDDTPNFMPALGTYNQNKQVREFGHDTLIIPSLTVKKTLGFADLTSVTGYFIRKIDRQADGTFFNSGALAAFFLDPAYPEHQAENDSILANVPSPVTFKDRFHTFTQELRLSSPASASRVKWVGGLFYSNQKWTHFDHELAPGFGADFQNIYGFNINDSVLGDPTNPHLWDQDLVWQVDDRNQVNQYAAFGQVDVDLTSALHLSVGDRYVYAKETFSEVGAGFFDLGGAGTNGTPYTQKATFHASTPRVSLRYDVSPDASVYGVIAKGFRLGGATTPNTNSACVTGLQQLGYTDAPTTYQPDQLWSYELGAKALMFDRTLSVNAAVYRIDWKRIQQTIVIPVCGGAFNANVGDAQAYGGEVEVRYQVPFIPGLRLGVSYGAERAVITSTINPDTAAVGQDVLNTPQWTLSTTADYSWSISDKIDGYVRGAYQFNGRSKGSFIVTDTNYYNPSYGVVNLSLGVIMDGFDVSAFVKNLTDDKTILQRPTINTVVEGYTLRPRTIGVVASKQF